MKKQLLLLLIFSATYSTTILAQDNNSMAKVEYEMAEEALAKKDYGKVSTHLARCKKLLGESNFKIDYLDIINYYDYLENPTVSEFDKAPYYFDLKRLTQKFLKDHPASNNKDKYENVYRIQVSTDTKRGEITKDFNIRYQEYRTYENTIDSLKFLEKSNWLEEKRGVDSIWKLGRTYDKILSYYTKKKILFRLAAYKSPITTDHLKADYYTYYHAIVDTGFVINYLNYALPDAEISLSGNTYYPVKAWFNASSRLCAIKYIKKNFQKNGKFEHLENAFSITKVSKDDNWQRYITANGLIIEYFEKAGESGFLLMHPLFRMNSQDPDGLKFTSTTVRTTTMGNFKNSDYFARINGYRPVLSMTLANLKDGAHGALVAEVTTGQAADKAGLKANDIITRIGYTKVYSVDDLTDRIYRTDPGEAIEIEYTRNGQSHTTKAVVGKSVEKNTEK